MSVVDDVIDAALEVPIVTSFTKIGYSIRSRIDDWPDLDTYALAGRTVGITGPTSGLGLAAARQLAKCDADLILIARDPDKTEKVALELDGLGSGRVSPVLVDLGEMEQVRRGAAEIASEHDRLDVLIHNAGALFNERRTAPSGVELTTAVQVVAPFLLTSLLLDQLAAATPGRVLTMSSGGMYTVGLSVDNLQMSEESYRGTVQYAKAKRAQVTLNQMWPEKVAATGIRFHALHPGWADTPGVDDALPGFGKLMGPILRSPLQGADTLVWLAADDGQPLTTNGEFWLDRRVRSIHKLPSTRRTDTTAKRALLWEWVTEAAGIDPAHQR